MFRVPFGRRALAASALCIAAVGAASVPARPAAAACSAGQPVLKPLQPLTIVTQKGRFPFRVEDADTPKRREIGLMCRTGLEPDRGMLFDFRRPTPDIAFWMHNTLIPLDMVFIRADGSVLSVARNAHPQDDTPIPAGGEVRGVLEIAGGRAAQIGLMPGDQVTHRIFPR